MAEQLVEMNQQLENTNEAIALFGVNDAHLKVIERELNVSIITRGETVHVSGAVETVTLVEKILQQLLVVIRKGVSITERDVAYAIQLAQQGKIAQFEELYEEEIFKTAKGKSIRVKTMGQRRYIHAMKKNDIVFGIGPAGTGKTYLAVVMAVRALKQGYVK
ncbi:PhoH family protein, partial [Vibrio parahaemolyticus]|nr:PhoH family protein [Vibrio parahaemolyticus]